MPQKPRIEVEGNEFEWDIEGGLLRIGGGPSLALWIESSLAGLMMGMQRMVGTERFNIAMQGGGRDSVEGDWAFISGFDSFEHGFEQLSDLANTCGWGRWVLDEIDREARTARFRCINGWESLYQKALGVDWGSAFIAGKFAGMCTRVFETNCWSKQVRFQALGDEHDEFVVAPSTTTVEAQLDSLLESDAATRADLAVALQKLQDAFAERQRAEQEAKDRLEMIRAQRRDLEALSAPILQIWDGVLTLPVLGGLSSERSEDITDRLLSEIQRTQARYAIIDVTGVEMIDTNTADHLLRIIRAVELLGACCVITGIRPAVAQTMVALGTGLSGIVTLSTLRDGLEYCMQRLS